MRRTIDSVLAQSILPEEYIFVDGGSVDGTLDIIGSAKFADRNIDSRILRQKTPNGIYGAINQGISASSSDIVFILHSDDWLEPNAADKVLAKFAEDSSCEIVLTSSVFHPIESSSYIRHQRPFWLFPFLMPVIHPGAFVSRRAYGKYGLYDENYRISSDYDFFYRCYKSGVKFCEVREPLVNVALGGTANSNRKRARQETYLIAKKHCKIPLLPEMAFAVRFMAGR